MNRIFATAAGPAAIALTAWASGWDFDSRTPHTGFWVGCAILYCAWQWAAPWWKDKP